MVKIVRARDAQDLPAARQVTAREDQIRSTMFSIRGEVLLKIQTALQNTSPTRRIQLQRLLDQDFEFERIRALKTIEKIIEDSIPLPVGRPVPASKEIPVPV